MTNGNQPDDSRGLVPPHGGYQLSAKLILEKEGRILEIPGKVKGRLARTK